MSYRQHQVSAKPEHVLVRANDIVRSATGTGEKEKIIALDQLHVTIANASKRKQSQWSKVYEQVMKRHVELCVDLKDHRAAKDGLHQYRNLCLHVDPNSLEIVILHLMELAENQAILAKQKANKKALSAAQQISDLDQEETPESIMLASMTDEGAKDRTDREVFGPWLKFLWEIYRAILELLNRNSKLEKVYHKTCEKAFKFCQDYSRKVEFRRLCSMLRDHLVQLNKTAGQIPKSRSVWEWSSDSIELHLQTRFSQLEVTTNLELWNEGFRTIEDIHKIMIIGKKTTKPKLMAVYYEKLTRIFWVSENYLFHAYSWYRFYTLTLDYRSKDLKPEEKSLLASCVLLSALIIPSIKDNATGGNLIDKISNNLVDSDETDEVATEKNKQLATVLDFQANPTRKALLTDIVNKGILNDVLPSLSKLYDHMEVKFHPLKLASGLEPMIKAIKNDNSLRIYAAPLQKVAVLRVIQQLSRVYTSIKIDFLQKLVLPLSDISYNSVEKIMIDGVSRKQIQLKIDHSSSCIRFGTHAVSVATFESQATSLGSSLSKVMSTINGVLNNNDALSKQSRQEYFQMILANEAKNYDDLLERQNIIEIRKENIEQIHANKYAEEEQKKIQQLNLQKEQEKIRLAQEEQQRNLEKSRKLKEKQDVNRLIGLLAQYGVVKDEQTLLEMDVASRNNLLTEAKAEASKAKEEEVRRISEQAKRLDYITRALRIEGGEVVKSRYAEQYNKDKIRFEESLKDLAVTDRENHAKDLVEKSRYQPMQAFRSKFEESILAKQRAIYEEKLIQLRNNAIRDHRDYKIAQARKLYEEDLELRREEEERELERAAQEERERTEREQFDVLRRKREEDEALEREEENRREKERERNKRNEEDINWNRREKPLPSVPARDVRRPAAEPAWGERQPLPVNTAPPARESRPEPRWGERQSLPVDSAPPRESSRFNKTDQVDQWRGGSRDGPDDDKYRPRMNNAPVEREISWDKKSSVSRNDANSNSNNDPVSAKSNVSRSSLDEWGSGGGSRGFNRDGPSSRESNFRDRSSRETGSFNSRDRPPQRDGPPRDGLRKDGSGEFNKDSNKDSRDGPPIRKNLAKF